MNIKPRKQQMLFRKISYLRYSCISCAVQLPTTSVVQDNQLFALQTKSGAGISYPLYQGGAHVLEDVFVLNCKIYLLLSNISYLLYKQSLTQVSLICYIKAMHMWSRINIAIDKHARLIIRLLFDLLLILRLNSTKDIKRW